MILFAIFEIFLVAVILSRALGGAEIPKNPDGEGTSSDSETESETQDPPVTSVFSGGVLPARPVANASTQTIGNAVYSGVAILVDGETGEIIASKNADEKFYPASLTKVMTLIVACEKLTSDDLDRKLVLEQDIWDYVRTGAYEECSVAGHDVGDEIKVKDLLYGIGVESAADCTMLVVDYIAGSESAFVALMNQKAAEMGLTGTHFDNVIGHESENNYSTAAEMAMIMSYAMQSNLIADILGVTQHRFDAYYYDDSNTYKSFGFTYYSTLFRSRMETYEKYAKVDFSLATAKLTAGKTGSFITSSHIVCTATKTGTNKQYILVLGNATSQTTVPASYNTMCDLKLVLDTYLK